MGVSLAAKDDTKKSEDKPKTERIDRRTGFGSGPSPRPWGERRPPYPLIVAGTLILLEAMMFAKPVVCCRAGGMPEVVVEGETSLLAEPGDAASLECALERLIEDPALRQRLGAAGRRRYEAHFTPEHMASDVAAFLCRTASVHRPGTPQSQAAAE